MNEEMGKEGVILGDVFKLSVGVKDGKVFILSSSESRLLDMIKADGQIRRLKGLLQFLINDLEAIENAK